MSQAFRKFRQQQYCQNQNNAVSIQTSPFLPKQEEADLKQQTRACLPHV